MVKKRQWLELVELGLLLATLITVIWSFFDGLWQAPIIFLTLTLGLNIFNRLNFQRRQRRQVIGAMKHFDQKFQGQIEELAAQVRHSSNIKSSIAKLNTKEEIQDYLGSLEKSLTNVVQYLNQEALDERISNLEQVLVAAQQEGKIDPAKLPLTQASQTTTPPASASEQISVYDPWESTTVPNLNPQYPSKVGNVFRF